MWPTLSLCGQTTKVCPASTQLDSWIPAWLGGYCYWADSSTRSPTDQGPENWNRMPSHNSSLSQTRQQNLLVSCSPYPLLIVPGRPHIVADFITRLPPSEGDTTILTIVCRLSKAIQFILHLKLLSALESPNLLVQHVFCLHQIPQDIVSNRGPPSCVTFWVFWIIVFGLFVTCCVCAFFPHRSIGGGWPTLWWSATRHTWCSSPNQSHLHKTLVQSSFQCQCQIVF